MDWKEYEKVTKYIYETLGKEAGVKIEGHGKDCKVKGKSGVEHQIDVLTSHSDGIHTYKTAIECKYWKDTVYKDIVMKVAAIIEDAAINKGVIVSKEGFTPDAISWAKFKNIGLVELREMKEEDWEGRPQILHISSQVRRPEILNIMIGNIGAPLESEEVVIDAMKVVLANGEEAPFLEYVTTFKKALHKEEVNKVVVKSYPLIGARIINMNTNKIVAINEITFRGVLTVLDGGIKWHPVDEIWLIMKSLFEDKSFTISRRGVITEDKSLRT